MGISFAQVLILVCVWIISLPQTLLGQAEDPDPMRFAEEIRAFEAWDEKNAVVTSPILFVGSSSIRFWDTAVRFPELPVVNRGFGGSHISDVNHFIEATVLKYAPRMIVFYAGDNDVNAGKSKETVLADYQEFVGLVMAQFPETDIVFLPIKPSLARWSFWSEMAAANELIRAFSSEDDRLHYVDVATPMLGSDGKPRPELLIEDGLHMTAEGYDIWSDLLATYVSSIM